MVDSTHKKVETMSRVALWRSEHLPNRLGLESDPFKMGIWNWHLSYQVIIRQSKQHLTVWLNLEKSSTSKEQSPFARFIVRVTASDNERYYSLVEERVFGDSDNHIFDVNCCMNGRFVIDVEFLDLKILQPNDSNPMSMWPSIGPTKFTHKGLSSMLHDAFHTDVTLNTTNGSIKAHKVILAANSPVFRKMFLHNLKESQSSTVEIQDMSRESCMAFLDFLYGGVEEGRFWKHRAALLDAANKYNVVDLKDACEESLVGDIDRGNVFERLREAELYRLHKLKRGCFRYLFEFGRIYDVQEKFIGFLKDADRDLTLEVFLECISLRKPTHMY